MGLIKYFGFVLYTLDSHLTGIKISGINTVYLLSEVKRIN